MANTAAGPLANLRQLRDERTSEDGRRCVDMAISSWRAKRFTESRQWIKQAFAADKAAVDRDIGELIEDLRSKEEARGRSGTVADLELGPAIDEAAIARAASTPRKLDS